MKSVIRMLVSAVAVILLLSLFSCGGGNFSSVAGISGQGWEPGKEYEVILYNNDTVSLRNLYVFMLHKNSFANCPGTLPLTVTVIDPEGYIYSEHWDFQLLPVDGETWQKLLWTETKMPYRADIRLKRIGDYKFIFSNDSPETVKGIRTVGIETTSP